MPLRILINQRTSTPEITNTVTLNLRGGIRQQVHRHRLTRVINPAAPRLIELNHRLKLLGVVSAKIRLLHRLNITRQRQIIKARNPIANQRINTVNTQLLHLLRHDRFGHVLRLLLGSGRNVLAVLLKVIEGDLTLIRLIRRRQRRRSRGARTRRFRFSNINWRMHRTRTRRQRSGKTNTARTQHGAAAQGDGLRRRASHQQSFGEVNGRGGSESTPPSYRAYLIATLKRRRTTNSRVHMKTPHSCHTTKDSYGVNNVIRLD